MSDGDAMESESAGHNPQLSLAIPEIITGTCVRIYNIMI